jgi:glycosyltransferase involved in cell wall biosynthesis
VSATLSIVIPTHNRRDLLARTLRSALAQDAPDIDVVVVDDGSSDGTADAVGSIGDSRVQVVRNGCPVRVAAARNQGAAAASGEWVAFLDDDDLWSPRKISQQLAASAKEGTRWAYAGAVEIDGADRLIGGEAPPSPDVLQAGLRAANIMPAGCSNVIIRADLFRASGGFDEALRHLADWDLWLRLIDIEPPACVPLPLVAYRIHDGQATLDPNGMIREARVLSARHGADLTSIRRWLAWSHLRRGERRHAVRSYARAVLAGDLTSLARAAVAVLDRSPTTFRLRRGRPASSWHLAAAEWLPRTAG